MALRTVLRALILCGVVSVGLFGQGGVPGKTPEFPVILEQSVTSGKTPVGSKIQAKLIIATLLNGTVIPRNAMLSGEVTESVAKKGTDASRLAIRMDSVQWKAGSSAVRVYFTGWYYPSLDEAGQDLQYGPQQSAQRTWNGQGQYPDPNSHVYRPFPSGDSDKDPSGPDTSSSTMAKNSVLIRDVEVQHGTDGAIVLTSKRSNIKLERYTTYVVSTGDAVSK
jgi:hypothetical protein